LQDLDFYIIEAHYFDFFGYFLALIVKYLKANKDILTNRKMMAFYDKFIMPMNIIFYKIFKNILGKNIFVVAQKI
jgi:hypothetical protein